MTMAQSARVSDSYRWLQLLAGIVCMVMVANLQYGWTYFVDPISSANHWSREEIQFAFSLFVATETWLVPVETWFVDKFGPQRVIAFGGVMVAIAWTLNSFATSLPMLYLGGILSGIGAGAVYGTCVGNALKWFPDYRGLTAGVTAGGYGIGTALTVAPIAAMIKTAGWSQTFITWGFIQGIVVIVMGLMLVQPPKGWSPPGWKAKEALITARVQMSKVDMTPGQMVQQGSFWALYFMFVLMGFTGLVVTAQLKPIAQFYHVDKVVVAFGLSALVLALQLDRILNGVARPFWGWVSDRIGRENTMFIAFGLQALTIVAWIGLIGHPVWFIVLSGFAFFSWSEIFSLFPSAVGDLFGRTYATTNYGILYTAKGVASIFAGPVAAAAKHAAGNWAPILWSMAVASAVAALMALFWLKPLARRTVAEGARMVAASVPTGGGE